MASRTKATPEPLSSRPGSRSPGEPWRDGGEDAARRAEQAAADAARDRDAAARLLAEAREEREATEDALGEYGAPLPPPYQGRVIPFPPAGPTPGDLTLDAWQERLEQLEPEGGVFVRVSRIGEHGADLTWVCNLTDPQGAIEEEIERIAQAKGHVGPTVRFRLQPVSRRTKRYVSYEDGRSSMYELLLAIGPAPPAGLTATPAGPVDPLAGAKTIVETAQALQPRVAVTDPVDVVTRTLGLMKELRPGETLSDKLLGLLVTALPTLKDLFAPKPSALENAMAEILKQRLTRELGEGGIEDRPDLVDEVDKFKAVIDVLKPLVGGGASEPRTVGLALIETLPDVVKHLAAPIDKFAEAYRWRVMHGAVGAGTPAGPPALPPAVTALWHDVAAVAARVDDTYFPALADRVRQLFEGGEAFLAALQAGQVTDAQGLETFERLGGALTPAVRGYLVRFFNWLRAARHAPRAAAPPAGPTIITASPDGHPPPPAGGVVLARCEQCSDEVEFDDEATWQARGDEPCERCGGRLRRQP